MSFWPTVEIGVIKGDFTGVVKTASVTELCDTCNDEHWEPGKILYLCEEHLKEATVETNNALMGRKLHCNHCGEGHTDVNCPKLRPAPARTAPAPSPPKIAPDMVTSLEEAKDFRTKMHKESMVLLESKGADYNRDQQLGGDTLFNLRVCEVLDVVNTAEQGILVRLSDKFMRLISLTKAAGREAAVKDESVLDTIRDIHNYIDYLGIFYLKRNGKELDNE